jgi:hypothetical protein
LFAIDEIIKHHRGTDEYEQLLELTWSAALDANREDLYDLESYSFILWARSAILVDMFLSDTVKREHFEEATRLLEKHKEVSPLTLRDGQYRWAKQKYSAEYE